MRKEKIREVTDDERRKLGLYPGGIQIPNSPMKVRQGNTLIVRRECDGGVEVHIGWFDEHQVKTRKKWAEEVAADFVDMMSNIERRFK